MLTLAIILGAVGAQPAAQPEQTRWAMHESKDKMTDQVRKVAFSGTMAGVIFVGCDAPAKYSVRVRFGTTQFLGDGLRDIMYRLDDQNPVTLTMQRYSDNTVYTFSTVEVTDWVKGMAKSKHMLVRLYDFRGDAVDLEYSMEGSAEVIEQAVALCNDKRFSTP